MPLFYSHTINDTSRLAIWHIAEAEDFFLEKVPISRQITHPHKRLQHLAGRYLLQHLFPQFPIHLIQIADTRKPYLPNETHHFSISHCGDYAAAIVSTTHRVGIDIEIPVERITRIRHKFLSDDETRLLLHDQPDIEQVKRLTLAWSTKESIFKWYSLGEMDFKNHMHLQEILGDGDNGVMNALLTKTENVELKAVYRFFEGLVLSWLATPSPTG
ncbi:MAG: 4'-phosphopantetheinyl transferase superfamily protein [Bacteroidota bacterium]